MTERGEGGRECKGPCKPTLDGLQGGGKAREYKCYNSITHLHLMDFRRGGEARGCRRSCEESHNSIPVFESVKACEILAFLHWGEERKTLSLLEMQEWHSGDKQCKE